MHDGPWCDDDVLDDFALLLKSHQQQQLWIHFGMQLTFGQKQDRAEAHIYAQYRGVYIAVHDLND